MIKFLTYKITGIEGEFRIPIEPNDNVETISSLIKREFSMLADLTARIDDTSLQNTAILSQTVHNEDVVIFSPTDSQDKLNMLQQIIIRPRYKSTKTFIVFSTINYDSMTIGDRIQIDINKATKRSILFQIKEILNNKYIHEIHQNHREIKKILLYLPGGIPFYDGVNLSQFIQSFPDSFPHFYSIVLYDDFSDSILNRTIENTCNISDESIRPLFSPYFVSEINGLCEIAAVLGYIQNNGMNSKSLIYSIAKFCPFAPLINSLFGLTGHVTGETIIQITAPLSVLFIEMSKFLTKKTNLFSSALNFLTYFLNIIIIDRVPCTTFTRPFNDVGYEKFFHCTIEENRQIESVIAFNPDFQNQDWIRFKLPILTEENLMSAQKKANLNFLQPFFINNNNNIVGIKEEENCSYLLLRKENNMVEYINPEVGTIETSDAKNIIFGFNRNQADDDENQRNYVVHEKVTQLVFFCICKSKSMDKIFDFGLNRFILSQELAVQFVSQCYTMHVSSMFGSVIFNSQVEVRNELTPIYDNFIQKFIVNERPSGGRAIFQAIQAAAEHLISINDEYKNAALRIILFCDGEDNLANPSQIAATSNFLIQNNIILDSFFLLSSNISKEVVALSHFTGGVSFLLNNYEESCNIICREEFFDFRFRKIDHINKQNLTVETFANLPQITADNLDKEIKIKESEFIDPDEPVIDPSLEYLESIINDPNLSSQKLKIIEQLKLMLEEPSEDIKIYPLKEKFDVWRVLIKVNEDSLYKDKWFCIIIKFGYNPELYSNIRFAYPPFHPNIPDTGKLYADFSSRSSNVKEIFDIIKQTLIHPNFDDPVDLKRKGMKIDDPTFLQLVNEWNQQNGKDSFNDWTEEWNIKTPIIDWFYHQPIYDIISLDNESNTNNHSNIKQFVTLKTDLIDQLLSKKALLGTGATSSVYKVSNCFTHKGFLCLKVLSNDLFQPLNGENQNETNNKSIWDDDDEEEEKKNNEEEEEKNEIQQIDLKKVNQLYSEYEMLNNFNHPNIVNVFGFYFGDRNHNPAILLEYCKFNLEKVINELDDVDLVGIIYEICSAMKYVHERNIIHRDLKMRNILINSKKHVKICDFGISKIMDLTTYTSITHGVGTVAFMAPEIMNENDEYNEKVDVYSFAVVMFFIVTKGKMPPFTGTGKYESVKLPKTINQLSRSIITKCWSYSPENRPSFKELLELIVDKNFLLIDGIEEKIPQLKKHLKLE